MPNNPTSTITRLLLLPALILLSPLSANAIFYGDDDYVEIDQIEKRDSKVDWSTLAKSVAVMIPDPGPGEFDLSELRPMRDRFRRPPLEADYKYGEQPSLARLTVFLVAPDKIMTAGHAGARQLQRSAFLFDYAWDSANKRLRKTRYEPSEIYRCKKVLLHRNDGQGDYAICQLDKPVTDRKPLTIEFVKDATDIDMKRAKMISSPDGTPLKLTNNGEIHGKRPTDRSPDLKPASFFFHSLDNSGGSSGAPIFDAVTGRVIGIQSGGDDNFTRKKDAVYATRGDFTKSNLGRPLKGEWGSLIPQKAAALVEQD